MTKRTIAKIPISPGTPVRVEDFRYVDQGLEWNIQNEFDLRDDHLQASRVINWEMFNEGDYGLSGWTPLNSFEAEAEDLVFSDGKAELYIDEGIAYIGGRGIIRDSRNYIDDGTSDPSSGATEYNIYLKYTESSNEFAFDITTSTRYDDHLIKYLLIATADWDTTNGWSGVADKRASNTVMQAPATISGDHATIPTLTVENAGAGLSLLVRLSDAQIGEDGTPQILTIWGSSTTGLTLKESGTANSIVLSCDASGRMKVAGGVNITGTITSGTWQGTAIANGFVAGLDQDCLQASSPTFVGLTLSGPIATATTIATSGNITCGGTLTADGIFPEADKSDVIGSDSLTWQDIFIVNLKDDGGAIFAKSTSDGKFNLNAGTGVNDIDTAMAGSPTDDQLLSAQGIKEYVDSVSHDADLAIGSGNATWINCPLEAWKVPAAAKLGLHGEVWNVDTTDFEVYYAVPLPTSRGGLNLYIDGTRIGLNDASGNAFVDDTYIQGINYSGSSIIDVDYTDKNSEDEWEDLMGAKACSGYRVVRIELKTECGGASEGNLKIEYVAVRYYYA